MAQNELFEIRLLVVTNEEEADLILDQIGDLVRGAVGQDRFGAALFQGVNPNGTEVPEGFSPATEDGTDASFAEAKLSASGTKTEDDDDVQGFPV